MSIMRRMRDMSAATLNDWLEQAQDPVKCIDQYLRELRQRIREAEGLYQHNRMHAASMQRQYLEAEQLREKREHQAETALKAGEESLARLALQEKMIAEEKSRQYKALYDQSLEMQEELEQQLGEWKADFEEVLGKREYYAARMQTIRLKQKWNERHQQLNGGSLNRIFDRWEDSVSDKEYEMEALRRVRSTERSGPYSARDHEVELELKKMKEKLDKGGGLFDG